MNKSSFTLGLLAGCFALCATSCGTPAGEGRKANAGYKAAVPVIAALEKFQRDHGRYPLNLNDLVPVYLPAEALLSHGGLQPTYSPRAAATAEGWDNDPRFGYTEDSDHYVLEFSYTGPGMNTCWYDSKTKQWNAHGHY